MLFRSQCKLPLIYLIGKPIESDQFAKIKSYLAGIGPSVDLLATRQADGTVQSSGLVEAAHKAGLQVHPYTLRRELPPKWSKSMEETHRVLLEQLQVDGFFTDFPDLGRSAVDALHSK